MLILGALVVLGGDSLTGFAIALLAGLVVGTWSSVFTASPLLVLLERRFPAPAPVRRLDPGRAPRPDRGGRRAPAPAVDPADPYAFVDAATPVSRRAD